MHEMYPAMIHRDFKPENIMISNDSVVIIDFGLAKFLPQEKGIKYAPEITQS